MTESVPIQIGLVGAGSFGSLHARVVAECEGADLLGVVDIDVERARRATMIHGGQAYSRLADLLGDERLDAVIVAVPDREHVSTALEVIEAGKPLLVEKPLADSLDGAMRIAEAARDNGVPLMVGHLLRFDPRFSSVARLVAEGILGELLSISGNRLTYASVGERVAPFSSPALYLGIHDIDLIQWITGRRIVRVFAQEIASGGDRIAVRCLCILERGVIAALHFGWCLPATYPTAIAARFEVVGSDAIIEVNTSDDGLRLAEPGGYLTPDCSHWPEVNGQIRGNLRDEVDHFVSTLRTGGGFLISPAEAVAAVAVADAIAKSIAVGETVEVER